MIAPAAQLALPSGEYCPLANASDRKDRRLARRGKRPTTSQADRRGIQSVEVSAVILSALAEAGTAIPLKTLSDIAGMPPSKTHRYLSSFIRTGLVRQDAASGRYDLGPAALQLGLAALSRFDVIELASAAMKGLTDAFDTTSVLSVWSQHGPTVVRWQRSRYQLVTSMGLGSILPVLSSATGRIFLSYLPRRLTDHLVSREIAANRRNKDPSKPIVKKADVTALVKEVRKEGLASVDSSVVPGLRGVAAPILDAQGEALAVITLIGAENFLLDREHKATVALKGACEEISLSATGTPPDP